VVFEYANDRPIIFSSFQPDAALLVKKLQSTYPVSTLLTLIISSMFVLYINRGYILMIFVILGLLFD